MHSPGHSEHCRCSACDSRPHIPRTPLISIEDLTFVRDERTILYDVNLTIDKGDFVAITGPNGGGKTTLLRLILGLLKPTEGRIVFHGSRSSIGYLPQKNTVDAHFPISVREVVASGLLAEKGLDKREKETRISHALEQVRLETLANRPIGRLSGGQLQRTLFGRAIVAKPQILVLDEPLSYIDKKFEEHLYSIITEIARDTTILLVSHEMSHIAGMANRHILVNHTLTECTAEHHYTVSECEEKFQEGL